jgi:ribonuclease D
MIITHQDQLNEFVNSIKNRDFITIDTEFLRDRTYYPRLCLIQIGGEDIDAVAIDPLSNNIDLAPIIEILNNDKILKVFHAARQDLEIFYNLTGAIPSPLFDTQVAAMVCGHGEQIGYNNLVYSLLGNRIDKGPQFTDWSRRPLSDKQLNYALYDVIYLVDVYKILRKELEQRGRTRWLRQEMDVLKCPDTYENHPYDAWKRVKIRTTKPKVLGVLQEVSALRERVAQKKNVPRNRILRDETLADMAIHIPRSKAELKKIRNIPKDIAVNALGDEILDAIEKALSKPEKEYPKVEQKEKIPSELMPVLEMLKMLLKIQSSEHEVASKLIASVSDLEKLAMHNTPDIPAMKGWRYEVFGKDAVALKNGEIALSLKDKRISKFKTQ